MVDTGILNPEKALIWRIVHRDNLPWIFANGMHSSSSAARDPHHLCIGNEESIARRAQRVVPLAPGGTLADYVPFYFSPFVPLLANLLAGHGGMQRHAAANIVILVSSLRKVHALGLPVLFTDRHAGLALARYFADPAQLDEIDWALLQRRDFVRDVDAPAQVEQRQAEALVHRHVPVAALTGVVCHSSVLRSAIEAELAAQGIALDVRALPSWYAP